MVFGGLFGVVGYCMGYFGKWYFGMLIIEVVELNCGGFCGREYFVLFWESGFDEIFLMEVKVLIWDLFICFVG